ncbi:MAG TPA: hypothetical protein ENN06_06555 [Desulfobacteraceae bacterium]|nr:hypothetical protein [Desulfobacteraceae bacterium]
MNGVKQLLYDLLVEQFNREPTFILARTLYLFCHDNDDFFLPGNVRRQFIKGLREQECRAFGLTYHKGSDRAGAGEEAGVKQEIIRKIAQRPDPPDSRLTGENLVRRLCEGTGKIYTEKMLEQINSRRKGILSYNDILEIFIMAQALAGQQSDAGGLKAEGK